MTELQKDIRIVIPAFNSCFTIQKCVEAVLDSMRFSKSWEIVIVDNGQNSNLGQLLKDYPVTILKRYETQSAAYTRNEGAKYFLNGILVFIDSDVICEKDCIQNLIKPLQEGFSNATIGNYSKNIKELTFSQKYKQLYINHVYSRVGSTIKNDFWTAICSIDAKVFNQLEGFNTNFKGANGEDQEFGIRLTKNGYTVISVNNANGQHLNPYGIFNIIKNDYKKGLTAVNNSLENKVPLSDNRHSRMRDILAVLFAVITITFLISSPFNLNLILGSVFAFLIWFICRITLINAFLKIGGLIFLMQAIFLMFSLDLVRFACVLVGIIKNKFLNLITRKEIKVQSFQIKS